MVDREQILINFWGKSEFDALSVIQNRLKYNHYELIKYKSFFTSDINSKHYEENVNKICNILKTELKDFFRKYYENRIDEFDSDIDKHLNEPVEDY